MKDSLALPYGEGEESEEPRSTAAMGLARVPSHGRDTSKLGGSIIERCLVDARSGDIPQAFLCEGGNLLTSRLRVAIDYL